MTRKIEMDDYMAPVDVGASVDSRYITLVHYRTAKDKEVAREQVNRHALNGQSATLIREVDYYKLIGLLATVSYYTTLICLKHGKNDLRLYPVVQTGDAILQIDTRITHSLPPASALVCKREKYPGYLEHQHGYAPSNVMEIGNSLYLNMSHDSIRSGYVVQEVMIAANGATHRLFCLCLQTGVKYVFPKD